MYFTKTDANFYYFKYANQPYAYTLPENGDNVKQIQLGQVNGNYCVFLLYNIGGNKTLLSSALEKDEDEERSQYRYDTGADIQCFDLLPDNRGNSILYTAGKGLYRFLNPRKKQEIVPSTHQLAFSKMDASQHEQSVALWAVGHKDGKNGLYYVNNRVNSHSEAEDKWTMPLQMHANIEEFESIKGSNLINQLYLFGKSADLTQEGLIHFWQDGVSTQWQEQFMNVDNMETTSEIETYTINLSFSAENMSNLSNKRFAISCDENIKLYINNNAQFLLTNQETSFDLADNQMVNIMIPVASLQTAKLTISGDFLDNPIGIDPALGTMRKLKTQLSSADALRNAKTQKGKSLVSASVSDADIKAAADAIGKMGDAAENLKQATPQYKTLLSASTSNLEMDNSGNLIGDLWHSVKRGFNEITSYVIEKVKEGYKVIVEIAGQVIDFIVDTVKKVVKVLEMVFDKIKTFFKDLFELLGYLFEWKDIITTKRVLKELGEAQFESAKGLIESYRKKVIHYFEQYKDVLKEQKFALNDKYKSNMTLSALAASGKEAENPNPKILWIASKRDVIFGGGLKSGGMNEKDIEKIKEQGEEQDIPTEILNLFIDFFKGNIGISEFTETLMNRLLLLVVEIMEAVVNKIFDWLIAAIDTIKNFFYGKIDIPILSSLYKRFAKDDLCVADFICLLIAIPMTAGYKLAYHEAPFQEGEVFNYNYIAH